MAKNSSRQIFVVLLVLVAVASVAFAQRPQASDLNQPNRSVDERRRDGGSMPLELYAFFGIEPGMTVADVMPGGGYNTYILTNVVGEEGTVYTGPDRGDRMADRLEANPLSNTQLIAGYGDMPAGGVDVLITVRNMHDVINGGGEAEALAAWMTALKPGGILGVVDARTTMEGFDSSTHRINEQTVIDAVTAAGFELVESSDLLANPDDDVTTRAESGNRYDIDRMVLKFRKPGM